MRRSATSVGHDLVYLPAFGEQLADPASSFAELTFTVSERRAAELRAQSRTTAEADASLDVSPHLAARFAAKEAFLKAWDQTFWGEPPPMAPHEVDFRDIEVVSDAWGRPSLRLHGAVAQHVGDRFHAELSLSHDGPFASAVVILHEVRS
jgi:holo-[acyl-carrier protein] synthase